MSPSIRRTVTITQVAQEARVSTQTVSRVINERPDVAPATRKRVQQVINRLGYRPNALARSLIHQRSHTLGVVATGLEYYGPSRTLIGVELRARDLGYSLLLDLLHHPETENVDRILNRLLSRQVDGIIWAVAEIGNNRKWLEKARRNIQAPIIYLSMHPHPDVSVVSIDNRAGGRLATQHLLEQGYRNIGLVNGPLDWWEARERQLGWQEVLLAAGRNIDPRQISAGNWSAESGAAAIEQLLKNYPEMDAVFAANDQMALGVMQVCHRLGRRVPQDLAIVGFDNIPESAYYWPPLTTIAQPLNELGCSAVEELSRVIELDQAADETTMEAGVVKRKPQAIVLQPELVVRDSSKVH
jgi:LacI family transcriptional regulator